MSEVLTNIYITLLTTVSWSRYADDSQHNLPEEDDETMSTTEQEASIFYRPDSTSNPTDHSILLEQSTLAHGSLFRLGGHQEHKHDLTLPHPGPSYLSYPPPCSFPAGYNQPTPFPSRADGSWLHPSFASSWSGYPKSLPSYMNQKDLPSCPGGDCPSRCQSLSLPSSATMSSLEQPLSLCSNPPSANPCHHLLPPYSCYPKGAACCAQLPADPFTGRLLASKPLRPQCHSAYGTCCKSAAHTRHHRSGNYR